MLKQKLRSTVAAYARTSPRIYDIAKLLSRRLGSDSIAYRILAQFERDNREVTFLQIGSNDGMSNDPLREFIVRNDSWSGCFVEPLPHLFAKLVRSYDYLHRPSLVFRNVAISGTSGKLPLYRIASRFHSLFPEWVDQVASFDRRHLTKLFAQIPGIEEMCESTSVEVWSPSQLIDNLGYRRVDVLCMDIEGHEKVVLDSYPFQEFCPRLLYFETMNLSRPNYEHVLTSLSHYGFECQKLGGNTIALRGD